MQEKLKETIDQIATAFAEFKTSNDERIKQIEKRGSADALLVAKVDNTNAEITRLQGELATVQAAIREAETASARVNAGGSDRQEKEVGHVRAFFAHIRSKSEDEVEISDAEIQQYRSYKAALNKYLRKGEAGLSQDVRAALSVGSDPAGGYLVTPDVGGRIVELVYESSPIRQLASTQPISTDALEGQNDLDEADSGWVGETGSRAETSTPEVGKYRIDVHEQYANPRATQKFLDDAQVNVEAWLAKKVAAKLGRREATAFVVGTGVGQPRGFMTYAAGTPTKSAWNKIAQVNSGASGAFASTNPGDKLIDLVFGLKAAYRQNASFLMARATVAEVRKLKDGNSNYLWQPDFASRQGGTLLGFPVGEGEDVAAIAANSLSIAFGDFKEAYQIVDHTVGIRVLRDPFTDKPYVRFYTTKRVGGDVVNFEAIRIMKFAA